MKHFWLRFLRWRADRAAATAQATRARFDRAMINSVPALKHFRRGTNGSAPQMGIEGLMPVCGPDNRRSTHALLDVVVPDHKAEPSRVDQLYAGAHF